MHLPQINNPLLYTVSATLVSGLAWLVTLLRLDPYGDQSHLALIFFYLTLFLFLAGLFTLINFALRYFMLAGEAYFANIKISFRQGLLLSLLVVSILAFQALRILTWWDGLLLVAIVILVESICLGLDDNI